MIRLRSIYLCCCTAHTLITSPVCGAEAEGSHLVWQRPVSIAAIMSVKSCRVVVLSMPSSIPVSIAVAVVWFGVSVIQVSGLWSLRWLGSWRRLGFRGVRRFTAVTAISAGDGTEILKRERRKKKRHIKQTGHTKITGKYLLFMLWNLCKNRCNIKRACHIRPITGCTIMFWFWNWG